MREKMNTTANTKQSISRACRKLSQNNWAKWAALYVLMWAMVLFISFIPAPDGYGTSLKTAAICTHILFFGLPTGPILVHTIEKRRRSRRQQQPAHQDRDDCEIKLTPRHTS